MALLRIQPLKKPVKATLVVPGSKSYTNRALLLAAMTPGSVKISVPLQSDDTKAMVRCLRSLGIEVISLADGTIDVIGDISDVMEAEYELDADLSGTTIRFMLALSAIIPGRQTLRGGEGLQKRPINDLVDALRQLGAKIEYLGEEGCPSLSVSSNTLQSGTVKLKGDTSSQFLSALLMITPMIGDVTIKITGDLISKPYVDMTIGTMEHFGAEVSNKNYSTFRIADGQAYRASEYAVEGDASSASYFFAIAALTQSTITVENLNPKSKQADMGFLKILEQMGNQVKYGEGSVTITGTGLKSSQVDMENCPDQAPTLAVLAAFVAGVTTITGIQSLRVKETERIVAVEQELKKMGIKTTSTRDTLVVYGGRPHAASISTYGDHRMAMAFAVAGAKLEGLVIQDPGVVSKTFPEFWDRLSEIGVEVNYDNSNLILIGMRGSGKTTVANFLSKKLDRDFIDIDSIICEQSKMTITELVAAKGWDSFRDNEAAITKSVSEPGNKIISTGGGVVLRGENVVALQQGGFIVFLRASIDTLAARLVANGDRPPLTGQKSLKDELKQLLKQRGMLYEAAANVIVDTDSLQPEEVAEKILSLIKSGAQ